MTPNQRIEATRRVLRDLQLSEQRAEDSGPPCVECVHLMTVETGKADKLLCGHIAYTKRQFDPTSGTFSESVEISAADARQDTGLCGPEALLFEPHPIHIQAFNAFNRLPFAKPAYMIGGGLTFVYALSWLGLS